MTASLPFTLDPRLAADTLPLCRRGIALLQVMRDTRFPWLILVPARPGLADLVDLDGEDEVAALLAIREASLALRAATACDKLNVAALGNMVRQLHVHIIARFEGDAAWPGPVWGAGEAAPFADLPGWALEVRRRLGAQGWQAA